MGTPSTENGISDFVAQCKVLRVLLELHQRILMYSLVLLEEEQMLQRWLFPYDAFENLSAASRSSFEQLSFIMGLKWAI